MNILLVGINAKYIHSNPAIYSLAAYAGKFMDADGVSLREHINIAEYTINQQIEDIEADIYRKMPDVLAVSCYIWNFRMVQELIEDIHQVRPDLPIWLGGLCVLYCLQEAMYSISAYIILYLSITFNRIKSHAITNLFRWSFCALLCILYNPLVIYLCNIPS